MNDFGASSVTLWLLDTRLVPQSDVAFFVRQLSASEARRYACFKRSYRQRQFLMGRMLLRFAVSRVLSLAPDTLGVVERDGTAPQLALPNGQCTRLAFSLSHSGEWVVCAVSFNGSLGVDIEVESRARDIMGISQLAFHPRDHDWLLRQPETTRLSAFYQLWCTREALYKLLFSLGREMVLSPLAGFAGPVTSDGGSWYRSSMPHSGVALVICSDHPLCVIHKVRLSGLTRDDWRARPESSRRVHECSQASVRSEACLVS